MPNNVKTYDGSDDSEYHLKIFQAAAKVEWWAIPTWYHMFNSTLIGSARVWFDDLPLESVDSYDELKKGISRKLPSTKEMYQRSGRNSPRQAKRGNLQKISCKDSRLRVVDEMMRVTTTFLRGEVAASNQVRKKTLSAWKQQEAGRRKNFERRGDFRNQQRSERRRDKFTLLTKSQKEILALDKGKFKTPPPMTTPVLKRNNNKFCEFHGEVGHNTDKCMHLRRQIEELIKAGKLSHVIKELKHGSEKDQPKIAKKGETSGKDKPLAILMVQPWQRVVRQRITQSFSPNLKISFLPLGDEEGTEGPVIIEAEIGGHFIHRIYVDGGSASEILYEHCFNRLRPEVENQMVPATAPLIGFSGEIIWPMGQILLPIKIGDAEHSTSSWMNYVVVRSPSSYNGIIGRLGVRKIQAILSTTHEMLKFSIQGGILTLQRSRIIPLEGSATPSGTSPERPRRMPSSQRNKAIQEEHDDSWRMCVDFKDLNKACPKDGYPLSEIDWKVESLCRYPFMCFLDAYKGYHQIKMAKEDEEKRAFITSQGIFCYSKMPFGLKNVGATYQQLGPKINYTPMEKLVLSLVHAGKRLKRYFQAHPIFVITDQPIKQVLSKPEIAGRLQKWSIELGEYDIQYRPKTSVKGQILADFIVERPKDDSLVTTTEAEEELLEPWTLFTDGSSCIDGFGAGLILTNPKGT
ncbi:reverse transcriptase domain-containing protein [Tanacetum coccineum]